MMGRRLRRWRGNEGRRSVERGSVERGSVGAWKRGAFYPHLPLLDTAGLAGMAGKIRNPKSETNSNEQRNKSAKPSRRGRADWSGFENFSFGFGACFGFRISDFGFVLAGQRCPAKRLWEM